MNTPSLRTVPTLALAWALGAAPNAFAQAAYRFEVLADKQAGGLTLPFSEHLPRGTDINHEGIVVGYLGTQYGLTSAAKWKKTTSKPLPPPQDARLSKAVAINRAGVAVGRFQPAGSGGGHGLRPVIWSADNGGTALACHNHAVGCTADDINDAGIVVGHDGYAAVRWSKNGKRSILPFAEGHTGATAYGIDAAGDIVGSSFKTNLGHPSVATIWTGGGAPTLLAGTASGDCEAVALTGPDNVVGYCKTADREGDQPVQWRAGVPAKLPLPEPNIYGMAFDIDATGTIVGAGGSFPLTALIWKDGSVRTLDSLVDSAVLADWSLATAYAINDQGQITGMAEDVHQPNVYYPYRLTPLQGVAEAGSTRTLMSR